MSADDPDALWLIEIDPQRLSFADRDSAEKALAGLLAQGLWPMRLTQAREPKEDPSSPPMAHMFDAPLTKVEQEVNQEFTSLMKEMREGKAKTGRPKGSLGYAPEEIAFLRDCAERGLRMTEIIDRWNKEFGDDLDYTSRKLYNLMTRQRIPIKPQLARKSIPLDAPEVRAFVKEHFHTFDFYVLVDELRRRFGIKSTNREIKNLRISVMRELSREALAGRDSAAQPNTSATPSDKAADTISKNSDRDPESVIWDYVKNHPHDETRDIMTALERKLGFPMTRNHITSLKHQIHRDLAEKRRAGERGDTDDEIAEFIRSNPGFARWKLVDEINKKWGKKLNFDKLNDFMRRHNISHDARFGNSRARPRRRSNAERRDNGLEIDEAFEGEDELNAPSVNDEDATEELAEVLGYDAQEGDN